MANEEWNVQVSIKHGPDLQYLTNVRGFTARDVLDNLRDLGDKGREFTEAITAYVALETVRNQFDAEPVGRYGSDDRGRQDNKGGGVERCQAHNLPREYRTGVKGDKKWSAWFCTVDKSQGQCAPRWVD